MKVSASLKDTWTGHVGRCGDRNCCLRDNLASILLKNIISKASINKVTKHEKCEKSFCYFSGESGLNTVSTSTLIHFLFKLSYKDSPAGSKEI